MDFGKNSILGATNEELGRSKETGRPRSIYIPINAKDRRNLRDEKDRRGIVLRSDIIQP